MIPIARFPRAVLIKSGACEDVPAVLDELGLGRKCLIFCDAGLVDVVGKRLQRILNGSYEASMTVPGSIDVTNVEQIGGLLQPYDFAIAVGGGRTIDIVKYTSHVTKKPWVSFPTIPSHDGIVSSQASLEESGKRISLRAGEPSAIIADLDIIRSAPYRFIAAGAGDCISKVSSVEDWKLAERAGKERFNAVIGEMCLLAARAVARHADEIRNKNDHGLEILLWSLLCCGFAMNIYGSSRPASGSEHNFSHALDSMGSRALHGEQVALGAIATTYLQDGDWRMVKDVMGRLGLPTTAAALGITPEMAVSALSTARGVRDRYTVLEEKDMTPAEARRVLISTGIIT